MIQERIAKMAADKENEVNGKLAEVVTNPNAIVAESSGTSGAAGQKTDGASTAKKIDIGTIAALSVTFTGIATVVGGVLNAFLGLGWWIPLGIVGILLAISLPPMILAYLKLRQRNIAPILDASGWAINGNTKISTVLGRSLTHLPNRPVRAFLSAKDPFAVKTFPWRRVIIALIFLALLITGLVLILKDPEGLDGVLKSIKSTFSKFSLPQTEAGQ